MSFLRPSAAKQTTATQGTGTLTLVANSGDTRSLQALLGSGPTKCRYMLRGNGYFEMGRGSFTAPGTLTRDEVIISSNSDNLVNIPPGTTDVYLLDYAQFVLDKFSATSKTLTNKDGSNSLVFTGSSNAVLNLPASAATLPDYWNYFRNDGTANLTLTPNGSDTVEGLATQVIYPGESGYLYLDGTSWKLSWLSYGVISSTFSGVSLNASFAQYASIIIGPGKFELSGAMNSRAAALTELRGAFSTTTASNAGTTSGVTDFSTGQNSVSGIAALTMPTSDVTLSAQTTLYFNAKGDTTASAFAGIFRAKRVKG